MTIDEKDAGKADSILGESKLTDRSGKNGQKLLESARASANNLYQLPSNNESVFQKKLSQNKSIDNLNKNRKSQRDSKLS